MIIQKVVSALILLFCSLYCYPSTQPNQLVNRDINYSTEQNKTNTYMLFDNSGQGNMTKIYDSSTNEIKFVVPINDSMIKIISK